MSKCEDGGSVSSTAEIHGAPKSSISDDKNTSATNNNNNSASTDVYDGQYVTTGTYPKGMTRFNNVVNGVSIGDDAKVIKVDDSASTDVSDDDSVETDSDFEGDNDAYGNMGVTDDFETWGNINHVIPPNEFLNAASSNGVVSDETTCFVEDSVGYPAEDTVRYCAEDIVSYRAEDIVTYPAEDIVSYRAEPTVRYAAEDIVAYPAENIVSYPAENIVSYPAEESIGYPAGDAIRYAGEINGGHGGYPNIEKNKPDSPKARSGHEQEFEKPQSPMYHFSQTKFSTPDNTEWSTTNSTQLDDIRAPRTDQYNSSSQATGQPFVAPSNMGQSSQNIARSGDTASHASIGSRRAGESHIIDQPFSLPARRSRSPEAFHHASIPSSTRSRRPDPCTSNQIIDQPFEELSGRSGSPGTSPRARLLASIRSRRKESSQMSDQPFMVLPSRDRSPKSMARSAEASSNTRLLSGTRSRRADRSSVSSQVLDPSSVKTSRRERSPQNRAESSDISAQKRILSSIRSRRKDESNGSHRPPVLNSGSRVRSIVGITTDTWHLNSFQTSISLGWFQQLHKRECVKFVPRSNGSSLCHCGKTRAEHTESAALEDAYGDCERGGPCIILKTTDAIIKYNFEGDPIESLFIRLDYTTRDDLVYFLLVHFLRMQNYKVFLHFLDFEEFKDNNHNTKTEKQINDKLTRGLQTLAQKTQLALTSTGLHSGVSRHVHNVLAKLCRDKTFHTQVFRLACPPWGILPKKKRSRFVSKKGNWMKAYKSSPRDTEDIVMTKLSAWFNHYLLFDEGLVYDAMTPDSSYRASFFRYAIEEIFARNDDAVNVCVMVNGGRNVLDHVIDAMERNIPVIVVKGTGGYADRLVNNHMRAETVPKKVLDEKGIFRYRSKLIPPKQLEDVDAEDEDVVRQILENNHMLNIFDPQDESRELDMVIYQALLNSHKETQLQNLLTSSEGDRGFESQWTDFLIEALLSDSPEVVDVILGKELCLEKHFTSHRLIQMYNRRQRLSGVLQLLEEANARNVKRLGVEPGKFCPSDVRLVLQTLLYDCYPLTCKGVSCQCVIKKEHMYDVCVTEREMYHTCLPPIQEMFLWTLLTNHQRMCKVVWKHCENKLASALVAEVVLTRMADKEENTDRDSKLKQNAQEFSDLAVDLLRTCYELDEKETHELMRKKSAWWGNQSVMELAYSFHSRKFISQPASMSLLDRIWMGRIITKGSFWFPLTVRIFLTIVPPLSLLPIIEVDTGESKGFSVTKKSPRRKWPKLRSFYTAPVVKHFMHVVTFVMFLATFSYVLLVDLQPRFTALQGVLCIWVATYCMEEIRQLQSVQAPTFRDKWWLYWKEGWNQIDVISIGLFFVGMVLAAVPHDEAYHFRRVCLSVDFMFFCMRLLQAFSIGSEIGPMLTMILKMIRITVTFVTILIVFMISYAVASESILFPRASPDAHMLYHVPRKAYWQIYGDFFLGEIEGTEIDCTNDPELYTNHTLPRCPSKLGRYLVPMMLAIYCIVTHVLMLNLLIAKFNDTYTNVQGEAKTHWAWYRCLVFYEFAHRRCFPPPLNVLTALWWLLKTVWSSTKRAGCCPVRYRHHWLSSSFTSSLMEKNVTVVDAGPSSIEVHWKCPSIKSTVTRYRILCYEIQDRLQGISSDARPNLAVTVYSGRRTNEETYTVTNLAAHTFYRLVVLYETEFGWREYNETKHNTLFKGADDSDLHESECVDQLNQLQTVDPIHHKLETISRAMNTMQEQFTKSMNQVTGKMTELQQKEESVGKSLDQLKEEGRDRSETQTGYLHHLLDERYDYMREEIHTTNSTISENQRDFYSTLTYLQEQQMQQMRSEISELKLSMAEIHQVQMSLLETVQKAFTHSS